MRSFPQPNSWSSAVLIDEFDAGRFKRTGYHISCRALIHGFSACIPIGVETHPPMGPALFS
jgi:hypothetical protein